MLRPIKQIHKFIADEEGAMVVEYAALAALIVAGCIAIIFILGGQIRGGFQAFKDLLDAAGIKPSAP